VPSLGRNLPWRLSKKIEWFIREKDPERTMLQVKPKKTTNCEEENHRVREKRSYPHPEV